MQPRNIVIEETSNLDDANSAGIVEIDPGETKTILDYRPKRDVKLLATGATDQPDCTFELRHGSEIVYDSESPLGTVNEPFSFIDHYGEALDCQDDLQLKVTNTGDSTRKFAGRWHI